MKGLFGMTNFYEHKLQDEFITHEVIKLHTLTYRGTVTIDDIMIMRVKHDDFSKFVRERIEISILDFMNSPRGEFLREAKVKYEIEYINDPIPLLNHGINMQLYTYDLRFTIPETKYIDYILMFE
jgi:hypothetical protein